jgi:hypothetical protein
MPDSALIDYARAAVERWITFAETHRALVVASVFGGRDFPRYREMTGRIISPATFVNHLVQKATREHVPQSSHFTVIRPAPSSRAATWSPIPTC